MKKILFGILTFLGIGFSFCSSELTFTWSDGVYTPDTITFDSPVSPINLVSSYDCPLFTTCYFHIVDSCTFVLNNYVNNFYIDDCDSSQDIPSGTYSLDTWGSNGFSSITLNVGNSSGGDSGNENTGSVSTITVYYNNGNSVENIICDGVQAIEIQGLSTITSTNTFTPYYNISYTDEDNQKLIESYSKDILYLSGGLFKKTYTGDNERILTDTTESPNSSFSGYLPTFEITGGIEEVTESGNIFNNFAENSVKFTLSNIPSYIQYVILLFILFFILGFIRKFRRK